MKPLGLGLMAAGGLGIGYGLLFAEDSVRVTAIAIGVILGAVGYLVSQRGGNSGNGIATNHTPSVVTPADIDRISQKMDLVQQAFFAEQLNSTYPVNFYQGYLTISLGTDRYLGIKNFRAGIAVAHRHLPGFQEGGFTYEEMVMAEALLDAYIASIPTG